MKTSFFKTMALAFALGALGAAEAMAQGEPVIESILTRTSVRKFTAQPVEQSKVETLLKAAMAAPTAVNRQPWHFVVVSDKDIKDRLADASRKGALMKNAPLAIVVCGDLSKAMDGVGREFWIQDTSAATENLLLAAHAMGLGAVWTSAWPDEKRCNAMSEVLGLPSHVKPLCTVVIGYPDEQPRPKDKWKPENVSYNQFGRR